MRMNLKEMKWNYQLKEKHDNSDRKYSFGNISSYTQTDEYQRFM